MQMIVMNRRAGKTTRMVTALKEQPNSILIVINDRERVRIVEDYKLDWKDAERILTPKMARDRLRFGKRPAKVFADNIDMILTEFLGVLPDVATYTAEEGRALGDWS